jgi:hypothetical protein
MSAAVWNEPRLPEHGRRDAGRVGAAPRGDRVRMTRIGTAAGAGSGGSGSGGGLRAGGGTVGDAARRPAVEESASARGPAADETTA